MRDFLACLLQVSFSARQCRDNLSECAKQWAPILRAIAHKSSQSQFQILSSSLMRLVRNSTNIQICNADCQAGSVLSSNVDRGSSLIESELGDSLLSHCFSFLSLKDRCLGIERTSKVFLDVSRAMDKNGSLPQSVSVFHSAKSCGIDLELCLVHWKPVIDSMASTMDRSVSEIICAALLPFLQHSVDCNLRSDELDSLDLVSNHEEMGSSMIETKLDDSTFAWCLKYLDETDVCSSIERVSHRFLQCSRQRKTPFYQEFLESWKGIYYTYSSNRQYCEEVYSPFEGLLRWYLWIPPSIRIRSLQRFAIGKVIFSPDKHSKKTRHSRDFLSVLPAIVHNIDTINLSYRNGSKQSHRRIPSVLSDFTKIIVNAARTSALESVCTQLCKCESLEINDPWNGSLEPINHLSNLKSLSILRRNYDDEEIIVDASDVNIECLPKLNVIAVDSEVVPHISSLLTPQIDQFKLFLRYDEFNRYCTGNLSKVKWLLLDSVRDSFEGRAIQDQLKLPPRIQNVKLHFQNWDAVLPWVNRAENLALWVDRKGQNKAVEIKDRVKVESMAQWSIGHCTFVLSEPTMDDIRLVRYLIEQPKTKDTKFVIHLYYEQKRKPRWEAKMKYAVRDRQNCQLYFNNYGFA